MSESIKVASMIASLSCNVTEFERGMVRASQSAEIGFSRIEKTASGFRGRLDSLMSNKGLFVGLKQLTTADDWIGKLGAVGVGLGGWSLAIGAAVSVGRELVGVVDQIATKIKQARIDELTKGTVSLKARQSGVDAANKASLESGAKVLESVTAGPDAKTNPLARLVGDDMAKKITSARDEVAKLDFEAGQERLRKAGSVRGAREQAMREEGFNPNVKPGSFAGIRFGMPSNAQQAGFDAAAKKMKESIEGGVEGRVNAIKEINNAKAGAETVLALASLADRINTGTAKPLANEASRQWEMATGKLNDFATQLEKAGQQAKAFVDKKLAAMGEVDALNPIKQFQDEMARIAEMGIGEDNENLLRGAARQRLDAAFPVVPPAFAGLIKANSAEASKAILATMLPKAEAQDRPLKELKDEAEKQTEILREIGRNTARQLQPAGL